MISSLTLVPGRRCGVGGAAAAGIFVLLAGCAEPGAGPSSNGVVSAPAAPHSLAAARKGLATHLLIRRKDADPIPDPPPGYRLVFYPAPVGKLPAYIAEAPGQVGKRPAMVWISGGFDNSVGDTPWAPAAPDNDQSARAFPEAGIITMYPAFRGGNNGPGYNETLYGEVNDAIAAADFLSTQPGVDPHRIYLGGHSTGGTLALLIAEYTGRFRAVFEFGAVASVADYGSDHASFDVNDRREVDLRSPILYLGGITSPTYAFEGTLSPNFGPLKQLCASNQNPLVHFYKLPGMDHFSDLAVITPLIAGEIMRDTGPQPHFSFLSQNPETDPADR